MKLKEELFQKNGLAVMKLASKFMEFHVGDKIPKVIEYARQFGLSAGTIQAGINYLREKQAVKIVSRGHLGSYIEKINYKKLQEYAGVRDKLCVMPLPYSLRYEGIATALTRMLDKGRAFNLSYMNGSGRRVHALQSGRYDCVLLSAFAAESFMNEGVALEIAVSLGPGSFLEKHVLIYSLSSPQKIKTLGVDPESRDQLLLTNEYVKSRGDIAIKEIPYTQIIKRIQSREIDGAIWNLDYIKEHAVNVKYENLAHEEYHDLMSEAVLVTRRGDVMMQEFLKRSIQPDTVLSIQGRVIRGELIPEY